MFYQHENHHHCHQNYGHHLHHHVAFMEIRPFWPVLALFQLSVGIFMGLPGTPLPLHIIILTIRVSLERDASFYPVVLPSSG